MAVARQEAGPDLSRQSSKVSHSVTSTSILAAVQFGQAVQRYGRIDFDSTLNVDGTMNVEGTTIIDDTLDVTGTATLDTTLLVSGVATFNATPQVNANLNFAGSARSITSAADLTSLQRAT